MGTKTNLLKFIKCNRCSPLRTVEKSLFVVDFCVFLQHLTLFGEKFINFPFHFFCAKREKQEKLFLRHNREKFIKLISIALASERNIKITEKKSWKDFEI